MSAYANAQYRHTLQMDALINALSDIVVFKDAEGRIVEANEYTCNLLKVDFSALEGRTITEVDSPMLLEDNPLGWKDNEVWQSGEPLRTETTFGRQIDEQRVFDVLKVPIFETDGSRVGMVIIGRDITESRRHELQLQATREELESVISTTANSMNLTMDLLKRSEALSIVGQLAAGVAHEIRNPLAALKGFTQLLKRGDEQRQRYCTIMLQELDRINSILDQVLMLAKPQKYLFQIMKLEDVLMDVIYLLNSQEILHNVRIISQYTEDPIYVRCVRNQLMQVFINILKNSIEASPPGSEVYVEVERLDGSEYRNTDNDAVDHSQPTGQVRIRCRDYGGGIAADEISRIGQPFHTTKENGTGLGMMITYKIVQEHQGLVEIKSEVNIGTTIDVVLPTYSSRFSIDSSVFS